MLAEKGVPCPMFETDYWGWTIAHSQIALAAYQKWQRGEGSGDAKVDWEMTRRGYGLLPYPTEEEIRNEAWDIYCTETILDFPGIPDSNWYQAEAKLKRRFLEEWLSASRTMRPKSKQ
jgi:hypothetical protein